MSSSGEFGNPLRKFKLVFLGEQSGRYLNMAPVSVILTYLKLAYVLIIIWLMVLFFVIIMFTLTIREIISLLSCLTFNT